MRGRRSGLAAIAFLPFLVAALLASAARAGDTLQRRIEGIEVVASSPWPEELSRGYAPFFVELLNREDRPHRVEVRGGSGGMGVRAEARKTVDLGPGERARFDLLSPTFFTGYNPGCSIAVRVDGGRDNWIGAVLKPSSGIADVRFVLFVARDPAAPGDPEKWGSDLSTRSVAIRATVPRASPRGDVTVAATTFDQLPRRYEGYASLDAVIIDTTHGLPPSEALDPLLAWARLGGRLAFRGTRAEEEVKKVADLAPWIEARFLRREWRGIRGYSFGHGLLVVGGDGAPFVTEAEMEAIRETLDEETDWVSGSPRSNRVRPRIPGVGDIPYRALAAVLVLFAFAIGPLNFWLVHRARRPILLLVTIPALALGASAILVGYAVFQQGLDVKVATVTATVLDQRTHRAATAEVRAIYAGLAPGPGLRPGPGASCYPEQVEPFGGSSREYVLDFDEGLLLEGDFLPVRRPETQVLLTDRVSRLRLGVREEAGALTVENGLDATIETLLVRDGQGRPWRLPGKLERGATARLVGGWTDPVEADGWRSIQPGALWPGAYLARLGSSPFADRFGVEVRELEGRHEVLGILDEGGR